MNRADYPSFDADDADFDAELARILHNTAPPIPGPEVWAGMLSQIESALPPTPLRRRSPRLLWGLGAMAAALALLLLPGGFEAKRPKPRPELPAIAPLPSSLEEPTVFAVASAEDVELLSLPEEAVAFLPIGRHPADGMAFAFAEVADVVVHASRPDPESGMSMAAQGDSPTGPMLMAPVAPAAARP